MDLLVVESSTKTKTINKYLGQGYKVLASSGHVNDLEPKEGAVDPENNFAMRYVLVERNKKYVDAIAKALEKSDTLYLATDPDREGEAIAYHIYEIMQDRGLLKGKKVKRIVFHEITKEAIKQAISNPRDLSMDLVNAQQARRALDYLVGFNLSPLLWKKIRPGLSAGRVQSPALKIIAAREKEIREFESKEYWTIKAHVEKDKQDFQAKLVVLDGKKLTQFSLSKEDKVKKAVKVLKAEAQGELLVTKLEKKQRKRNPAAPFTTSTLQQEASRKLGFGTKRTMTIAQQLYEGVDVGEGTVGLISYMRTDSVSLADSAVKEIRAVIKGRYGKGDLPSTAKVYKTKAKSAQEAHEAIRPTSAARIPAEIKQYLSADQFKLYDLIWKRTIACQMIHATINTVAADLTCGNNVFRANGSSIAKPGFMQVYQEGVDDVVVDASAEKMLPEFKEKDKLPVLDIKGEQHFTEPPPRFSEASLVKFLEEKGIGRPSTYVPIISTLQQREYVVMENKRFVPTDVGEVVANFLDKYFTTYVDYDFTSKLEQDLDAVAAGEREWKPLLKDFWKPFISLINGVQENVQRRDVTQEAIDENCPECGKTLSSRLGRKGRFIGCTGYPECKYTRSLDGQEQAVEPEVVQDRVCPECNAELLIKTGRYGKFIGCSGYPKCAHMEPLEKPKDSGVSCPECNKGTILERKSRYGKLFYSCERYPVCKYAVWNTPVKQSCPKCNWPILTVKITKRRGEELVCPQKECDFIEAKGNN